MAYGTALLKQTKKGFYKIFVWDFMEGQLLSGGCSFFKSIPPVRYLPHSKKPPLFSANHAIKRQENSYSFL
jgi:hypothetical protein